MTSTVESHDPNRKPKSYKEVVDFMNVDWFCTFLAVPLELLYNVVFPILMAIVITIQNSIMVGVLVFLAILTANCFKGKMAFINVYVKSKLRQG